MDFDYFNQIIVLYGSKIILAVATLVIGLYVIKKIVGLLSRRFSKIGLEKSLQSFSISFTSIGLKILLAVTIASMLGAEMTSFVAILGSAGLAVGLALQGSLSNFAGGVLILILKPFKVGDYIEAAGHSGTVSEIQVFYTILNTPDNKKVIIPNSNISNGSVTNYSANTTRRVDLIFSIDYDENIERVKKVLINIIESNSLILKEPYPQILVGEHGDSSVNLYVRVWCENKDYWNIYFGLMEKVKVEFDKESINIPYPQVEIQYKGQKAQ
ncbi:mechanosensitive ion channel protein MscS [Clostridium tetani]|uniref:Mechanosensitive ion channel protein MscS n=1 Tax=Clostridium tetani TaxID=1513 RepID=A0ABC8EA34_CLOTA|nr:mechanosensitive ion channel domain-containing protein [Clostridium tetani]BDR80071.1 mechanosensitive ion channel protein MscS [Clostridium tetani]BDR88518.1 mechanosensitive ion channel protein MscS [Clostridium tetani]